MAFSSAQATDDQEPPEEVLHPLPYKKTEAYLAWRATTDLRAPYRIAPQYLEGTKPGAAFETDESPLVVFINARSGGRVGAELAGVLARAVGSSQVFDLSQYRPDRVLRQIWDNLQRQEQQGNHHAALLRSRLRILACGGDGTIAWILKVIHQLDLQPQPAVAIMPLGTGNDLSRSFRWGAEFEHNWIKGHASVYSTLKRVADAPVKNLDCWRLRLLLPHAAYQPAKTYAMTEVQQQQQAVVKPGCVGEGSSVLMEGMFWNYFSVGADAQAAYNFHHLRDTYPMLAPNRMANQLWYSTFSCTSGWFCSAVPSVSGFSSVQVLQPGSSSWQPLAIPNSVKALVMVNLQSYGGGRNLWGEQMSKLEGRWKTPSSADGLIEVVGFKNGFHGLAVMASGAKLANGTRLGQVAGIRLSLRDSVLRPDGEAGQVFMQLDGEPWVQKVPAGSGDTPVVLEVMHAGISKVLCNATEPDDSPEHKMAEYLSKSTAAAYLTHIPTATQPTTSTPQHQQQQKQKQQMLADHVAAGSAAANAAAADQPAAGPFLPPTDRESAAALAAAHVLLQPPSRIAHTDGGVPYAPPCPLQDTSGVAAAAAGAVLARRSLDLQPGEYAEGSSSSGGVMESSPASTASTEAPSAVAVIEARMVGVGGVMDGAKKQGGGVIQEGKGVGAMLGSSSGKGQHMPPPAFVQLTNQQAGKC